MGRRAPYNKELSKMYLNKAEIMKKMMIGCASIYTGQSNKK
jgi:hypothetical protein